jgi:hypothetical protein
MATARLRPSGSGRPATAATFRRATTAPPAALVLSAAGPAPDGWPHVSGPTASDAQLGHAVGWVCEIRRDHLALLNPLGEGVYRAPLPALDDGWVHDVRASASTALFVVAGPLGDDAATAVDRAAEDAPVAAATVRTAFSDDFGRAEPVGRNAPCPCGSGKKFKHCHGR